MCAYIVAAARFQVVELEVIQLCPTHSYTTFPLKTYCSHNFIKRSPNLQVIETEQRQFERWVLTGEGVDVMEKGSHEARMFQAVDKDTGSLQAELMVSPTRNL